MIVGVENPVVLDLPRYNLSNYDSDEYWDFGADDGTDAQDESDYCVDLRKRLEEVRQRKIANGEWDATCEENFQWLIKR